MAHVYNLICHTSGIAKAQPCGKSLCFLLHVGGLSDVRHSANSFKRESPKPSTRVFDTGVLCNSSNRPNRIKFLIINSP